MKKTGKRSPRCISLGKKAVAMGFQKQLKRIPIPMAFFVSERRFEARH